MNALVLNTLTGAVSEYTRHAFHGITPTSGGSADGLFEFGGDDDDGLPIVARVRIPTTLREGTLKKRMESVYFSMGGAGAAQLDVHGAQGTVWPYPFQVQSSGQSRCVVGRGIRENYVGFCLSNPAGQHFTLDRVEVLLATSKTRRI